MKRISIKLLGVIFIAMTTFSCAKEQLVEPEEGEQQVAPEGYINFSATIDGVKTTTTIVEGASLTTWDEGDEITITVSGDDTPKTYVANSSGKSTTFSPKTEADRIPRAVGDIYTLTASYGGEVLATQNINSEGINDCLKPLAASLDAIECPDGNINLTFSQTAALLDFKFAKENLTLTQLIIKTGSNPGTITVNFPDELDLSSGNATAQVVIASLSFTAMNGVELEAHMKGKDTPYRRLILLGKNSQDYKAGKHTRLNMTKFQGAEIKKGADLRELALTINKGWNREHFRAADNCIHLGADIDISDFQPWEPIGKNNNKELDAYGLENSYVLRNNFEGHGYTISGLTINNDADAGKLRNDYDLFGLFGIVNANINDLNVEGTVAVRSSSQTVNLRAGGIAAVLMPGKTISNCTSNVEVNVQVLGREKINSNDKLNATSADLHKWQRVGGIVGECRGNIIDCTNNGLVKNTNGNAQNTYNALTNAHYGGIAGHICNYGDNNVTISGCSNTANLSWGGKAALAFVSAYSYGTTDVTDAQMQDQVVQGVSIGGIVGTAGHMVTSDQEAQGGSVTITGCTGTGSVELSNVLGCNAGGIVGRTGCDANVSITDCHIDFSDGKKINAATCSSKKENYSSTIQSEYIHNGHVYRHYVIIGGIVGAVHCTSGNISYLSAQNGGVRTGSNCYAAVGGIIGFISHCSNGVSFSNFENKSTAVCYNSGSAGTNGSIFGGIIGRIARACSTDGTPSSFVTVTNAVNRTYVGDNGKTQQQHSYGGIVGMGDGMYLKDCANYGEVSANSSTDGKSWHGFVGGICGYQRYEDTPSCLENCWSYGKVLYDTGITYRGLGLGEAECCRALNCRYCGTIGDAADTGNQITLSSSNWSTYTNDGVHTYASGGSLTPLYAAGSDASESAYYGRIGAKASNWQWTYHDSEQKDPFEEPDDPTADPASSLGGTYATVSAAQHPRLFLNDTEFASLKTKVTTNAASNTQLAAVHNVIMDLADAYVTESSPITHTYDASGRRILTQSHKAVKRIFACSYAYRMTGDTKYLSKVNNDMRDACNLSDWNATQHMLDAAEMCFAVAVGYDWCYNDLSPEIRSKAHAAIKNFALTQTDPDHNYPSMTNNWNQVCFAGMVAGALAIYEKDKTISANMVESALSNNPKALTACYSNGNYPEGYSYWSYGTDYQALLNLSIKRIFGTCGALETTVDFSKTAKWMLMMDGPTGKTFPYGDCSPITNMPQYAMWYMADKCSNTSLLYNESLKLNDYDEGEMIRLLPLVPIAAYNMNLPANISGISDTVWPSSKPSDSDVAPVVLVRSGWTGSNDMFLGVKGGKANQSHSHMDAGSFVFDAYGKRWSSDIGSCNYASVEAAGIELSNCGESSSRWHVFINNRFSHSTLMKKGSSYTDGTGKSNYAANATAPITTVYSSSTEKGAKVDLTDVMYLSSSSMASPEVTRTVVLNPSTGVVTITDHIENPSGIFGGEKQNFWSRILTEANVNKQSNYIELSFADCAKRYRYQVSSGSATLETWAATNPGGNASWDDDKSGEYSIIGCSFSVSAGSNATVVTTLTPVN